VVSAAALCIVAEEVGMMSEARALGGEKGDGA